MTETGFCTKCGAPRAADARFCTACGSPLGGAHPPAAAPPARRTAPAAIAMGALLVAAGSVAAFFALREPPKTERAVAGSPTAGVPQQQAAPDGALPTGHPSIELPKEVLDFLDGLTAETDKNPGSVDAWQKLARARYRASIINGSYRTSAEQALAKLLALDPANTEGLRISANLAYDAGDFPEAEKRFLAFLEKNPDDASALTDLGSVYLFQERTDEAVKTYDRAIAKDPKFLQAHFNLGIAREKLGDKDAAIASLKRALDLAGSPDQKQHVENALAEVEGREPMKIAGAGERKAPPVGAPAGAPTASSGAAPSAPSQGGMQGGMPMPPPAPDRPVATNASSDFQKKAEKPLVTHPIVGPRIASFEWTGHSSLRAKIADFPMDQMPPFARVKFKSGMAAKLDETAKANGVAGPVRVELVDDASGRVMDTIDSVADAATASAPAAAPTGNPAANGPAR